MSTTSTRVSGTRADGRPRRREHRMVAEIPLVLFLMLVWAVLWAELSLENLVVGLVFAVLVTRILALPPVQLSSRFNVAHAGTLLATFLGQVIMASFQVMWVVLARGPKAESAIVGVSVRSHSDVMLTATGNTTGLIPGSVLLEVDRSSARLYFHVLDVHTSEDMQHFRDSVLNTEAAWIRLMGSPEDLAALRREDLAENRRHPMAVLRGPEAFGGPQDGKRHGGRDPDGHDPDGHSVDEHGTDDHERRGS